MQTDPKIQAATERMEAEVLQILSETVVLGSKLSRVIARAQKAGVPVEPKAMLAKVLAELTVRMTDET